MRSAFFIQGDIMLEKGIKNTIEETVTTAKSAKSVGSGNLNVYATPTMISLMEKCCFESVEKELDKGYTTVGSSINFDHVSPSPIGAKIICYSTLSDIEGKKLLFIVKIYDDFTLIGQGTHERYIVNKEKFINKAKNKKDAIKKA